MTDHHTRRPGGWYQARAKSRLDVNILHRDPEGWVEA